MAPKYIVAHRADPNNIGDRASNPLQYFLNEDQYRVIDVAAIGESPYPDNVPMIVGGGGLIGNDFMGDFLPDLLESPDRVQLERMWKDSWSLINTEHKDAYDQFHAKWNELMSETMSKVPNTTAPRFVWGAGHNGPDEIDFQKIKWPKALSKYKLVGIRDFHETSRFHWAPCASCMHPALNKEYAIKNDVIIFEHKKQMIKDFGTDPIPRFINSGSNLEQTIELLGSANVILTNSYHGAYWGTLLKKKVMIIGGAWSSKFKFFKHPPMILGKKENWKDYYDNAPVYHTALEESVAATENFWNTIKEMS